MIKTILIIITSVALFGLIFFVIVRVTKWRVELARNVNRAERPDFLLCDSTAPNVLHDEFTDAVSLSVDGCVYWVYIKTALEMQKYISAVFSANRHIKVHPRRK